MNEDLDFRQIEKKMPYEVPEDFFERITKEIVAENHQRMGQVRKKNLFKRSIGAAAAIVILAGGSWFLVQRNEPLQSPIAGDLRKSDSTVQIIIPVASEQKQSSGNKVTEVSKIETETNAVQESESISPILPKEKIETLNDALKSISDEELAQLASLSENDMIVDE